MAVHLITYFMQQRVHAHEESCGCGEDHHHEHDDNCGCGEEHHHEHNDSCGCGEDHHHEHGDNCGCGEDHEHGEDCGCGGDPDYDLVCTIETLGKWAQFTPTGFLVVSDLTSDEIIEKLQPTVSPRDIIFVTKVDPQDVACTIPQCKDWILSVTA